MFRFRPARRGGRKGITFPSRNSAGKTLRLCAQFFFSFFFAQRRQAAKKLWSTCPTPTEECRRKLYNVLSTKYEVGNSNRDLNSHYFVHCTLYLVLRTTACYLLLACLSQFISPVKPRKLHEYHPSDGSSFLYQ